MNYISALAVDEKRARERVFAETGYAPETVGRVACVIDQGNNSRQQAFVFEASPNVTEHPLFVGTALSQAFDLTEHGLEDGPVLQIGAEVTVGG